MAAAKRPRRPRLTAAWLALATALVAVLGGSYLIGQAPAEAAEAQRTPIVPVRQWDEYSGRLEAVGSVEVRARVAGTVEAIHVEPGALVQRGETLFTLDPAPFVAELVRAEVALAVARRRVERAAGEQTLREAQALLLGAEAAHARAQRDLDDTRVVAPISGHVGRVEVRVGQAVRGGAARLTSIVSASPIVARRGAPYGLL